jgi:antirestriction protein ArdC
LFGSESYSREELIAEMGAAMLCGIAGIEQATVANSAAYLKSWIARLKADSRLVVQAASAAQKAALEQLRKIREELLSVAVASDDLHLLSCFQQYARKPLEH